MAARTERLAAPAGRLSRGKKIGLAAAATGALAIGLMGFAHTRAGRPLLAWFGGAAGGCPVSLGKATPDQIEQRRGEAMLAMKGQARAPARPALGFTLMTSTREDVARWTRDVGARCKDDLNATALRCEGAPGADGPLADLLLRFDPRGTLVALDAMHRPQAADAAARSLDLAAARLSATLGVPASETPRGAAALVEPYARASVEYRFRDYAVDVSATTFEDGVVVREQYRAIPD